jgi:hypothetical protein
MNTTNNKQLTADAHIKFAYGDWTHDTNNETEARFYFELARALYECNETENGYVLAREMMDLLYKERGIYKW